MSYTKKQLERALTAHAQRVNATWKWTSNETTPYPWSYVTVTYSNGDTETMEASEFVGGFL